MISDIIIQIYIFIHNILLFTHPCSSSFSLSSLTKYQLNNVVAQYTSQCSHRLKGMNTHIVTYSHHVDNVTVFEIISHKQVNIYIIY